MLSGADVRMGHDNSGPNNHKTFRPSSFMTYERGKKTLIGGNRVFFRPSCSTCS
jgi:hypothetical protein